MAQKPDIKLEKLKKKLTAYQDAVSGFVNLLAQDLTVFDKTIKDGLMNGQVQKFEYCTEMTWRFMKKLLEWKGLETTATPRDIIREFAAAGFITTAQATTCLEMIDTRNSFSHVYDETQFIRLYGTLGNYARLHEDLSVIFRDSLGA